MTVTFLGTRGEIELRSELHGQHSALAVGDSGGTVMVDCGLDWAHDLGRLQPAAIVVTHAHSDHAGGLRRGAPCPVYATEEAWRVLGRYPLPERLRVVVRPREPVVVCGVRFEAFPVEHSLRAPAVGYRIGDRLASIF